MKTEKRNCFRKTTLLMSSLLISMGSYAQNKNFEYTYGGINYDTEIMNLKVAKDKSILSTSTWYNSVAALGGSIVHKVSPSGKLIWKTILECEEGTYPSGLYELEDSSVVLLVDVIKTNWSIAEESVQLIKLNKNGSMVASKGFSNKLLGLSAGCIVGFKNHFYTISNDFYAHPKQTTIQKFDQNLNQLASVTINGINSVDGVIAENKLLLVGCRDTINYVPTLIALDTSLNVIEASQYNIMDAGFVYGAATKIIVDQNKPVIVGDYQTSSGVAKRYFIYPHNLSASRYVYGDIINDLTIKNNSLYIAGSLVGTDGILDCYIAKYDPLTETKKWIKGYGGKEHEELRYINIENSMLYSAGISNSFSNRTSTKGLPVQESYLIQADTNGNTGCTKDITTEDIHFAKMTIEKSEFDYTTLINDTLYTNVFSVITPAYFDSLACYSAPTSIKQYTGTEIQVYPTITKGILNINHISQAGRYSFEIINTNGQVVMTEKLKDFSNTIDIASLSNGLYLLRIFDEKTKNYSIFKIVKE